MKPNAMTASLQRGTKEVRSDGADPIRNTDPLNGPIDVQDKVADDADADNSVRVEREDVNARWIKGGVRRQD